MVSFQCQSCGDVVKKPKLDQHHGRCYASFDCIDCSVTFKTPAEYKSHTSCISEAEKYEKSLYTGPKNGHANGNLPAGQAGRGGVQGRGRGNVRGGLPGRGGYQGGGRGRPRYEATGANDLPLGTPQRMSPVTLPADGSPESKTKKATKPASTASPAKNANEVDGAGPPSSEQPKKRKSKARKSKSEPESKEAGIKENESTVVDDTSKPSQPSVSEATGPTKKKEKKKRRKEEGDENPVTEQSNAEAKEQGRGEGSKEKHKKKKSKGDSSTSDLGTDVNTEVQGKGGKCTSETPVAIDSAIQADEQEVVGSKERKKKKSKDKVPAAVGVKDDLEPQGEIKEAKGGKKKRKSERTLDEPAVPLAESVRTPLQSEEPEKKKSKKRKRDGEGEGVKDRDVADSGRKKTKKDSKVKDSVPSKEPSSGKKKRKGEERDEGKEVIDDPLPGGGKEKKKRKNEKQASSAKD